MVEIVVTPWVDEHGRRTRRWYWEVHLSGKTPSAGIATSKEAAWQHGVEGLALCAYQRGMADAQGDRCEDCADAGSGPLRDPDRHAGRDRRPDYGLRPVQRPAR